MADPSEYGLGSFLDGEEAVEPSSYSLVPASAAPPRAPQTQRRPTAFEEAKARHRLVEYYLVAAENPLFDNPNDPMAARVQAEVSQFVAGRVEELTGGAKPQPPGSFTPIEVKALKAWAKHLLTPAETPEPQIRPAAPAPVPQAAPPAPVAPPRPVAARPAAAPPAPAPAFPGFVESYDEEDEQEAPGEVEEVAPIPTPRPRPKAPQKRRQGPSTPVRKAQAGRRVAPAPPAAPAPAVNRPGHIPMPTGAGLVAAMSMKAHEALSDPHLNL